jgi:hydrogenase/urease accessory protein HupE
VLLTTALVAAMVANCEQLYAHEIGTSRVAVTFSDEGYVVDFSVDAGSLLARLEAQSGLPRSRGLSPAEYPVRIHALREAFVPHVVVRFDGQRVPVVFDAVEVVGNVSPTPDLQPPTLGIRLHGAVPAGARTFTLKYDLTSASYALTIKSASGRQRTEWLEGDRESQAEVLAPLDAPWSRVRMASQYFQLGYSHILPNGLDHILFVLGVFLFGRRLRPILCQVSAFTIAHSITLGLALYGVVSLPPSIVEPLIAASIVYVGVENIFTSDLKPWRVALVFGFGLLHGMGFAGALRELALPRSAFLTGLLMFNAGVEAGQLTVIAAAFLLVGYWTSNPVRYRRVIVVPGSALIAVTGLYWTIVRLPRW